MGKEKKAPDQTGKDLDELDKAFDDALAGLSDANARVTEVLDTMDDTVSISPGADVDGEDNTHEENPTSGAEPSDS